MADYKTYLGILSVALQLISYSIYFTGIWKGRTKPHAFTWMVWGFISVIAFTAIISAGGGAGAWVLGINALLCLTISAIGFKQKRVTYDLYDWLALIGGLLGVFLWWQTKDPLYAVILVALSDSTSAIPTFRKAYRLPFEENALAFSIGIVNYPIAILALRTLNITTWLYPATIVLVDAIIVAIIFFRRRQLGKKPM